MHSTTPQSPDNYVAEIRDHRITVRHVTARIAQVLTALGGTEQQVSSDERVWILVADDEHALGRILMSLRDHDVLFSFGPGWNPADIFIHLRDKSVVQGPFHEVAWRGPGQWSIRPR